MTSSLFGVEQETLHVFQNKLTWKQVDEIFLHTAITCSNWTDRYRIVSFDQFELHDIAIFRSYDARYVFYLQFNRETSKCTIEFNEFDKDFDVLLFKQMMETVFLYD
jgi:hypothetical protein